MKSFFRFFAERHVLANLVTVMIILLGLTTIFTIKRDSYPNVDFGWMSITTVYPGASPEDVELNVTNKIEEELQGVTDLDRITSLSMENVSKINVFLDPDATDPDDTKNEIREAVNRVTDFPDEVDESPFVLELTTAIMPVLEVGISGELPYRELREIARIFEKKLKDIPGVSRLDRFGYRSREIRVEVSPEAIEGYQIPLREIIAAIQARNIRATTGSFESYTSEKNLVTLAQFGDPLEVGNVIVRSSFDGPIVEVNDLAIVKDDFEDETVLSRMNGKAAISFLVYKTESKDIIRLVDEIKALVGRERENLPEGVEILYTSDFSNYVRNRLDVVRSNGLIGLAFVLILLSLFLNVRTAFWVAIGIPVALFGAIFLMPLFDVYLDSITVSSMIMVLGIIVDDAIIVAENIFRCKERGDPPLEAAVEGIRGVMRPVLTTILTTFLAFAPMFFMTGLFGKFIFVIPVVISLALFISLIEIVVALPAHLVPSLTRRPDSSSGRNWFSIMREHYRSAMKHILKFRYAFVTVFVITLAGALWYAGRYMQFILFTSDMADQFYIMAELPKGASLEATSDKAKEIEEIVAQLPEEELASFVTRVGTNPIINAESENYAALDVNLTPFTKRDRNADQIVEDIRQKTDELEGFDKIIFMIETGGPPVGKPVSLVLSGSDDILRKQLADSVVTLLASIDGVKDIERDDKPGKDQVEIKVDYKKLSRLNLTVADVAQNVRIAYDGEVVTSVRYGDEDVDFRVLIQEKAREQFDYLGKLLVPNRQGRLIPLRDIARLETGPGPSNFRHYNGDRSITIEADLEKEKTTPLEVTSIIRDHFNLDRDWPGMRFILGGEAFETEKSVFSLFRTLIIAIVGIYFLLILLFNSMTQPIVVLLAIPFGIVGVIFAFALHNEPLSFIGILGVIGLIGVVVNDSLVLVNHVNELRGESPDADIRSIVAEGTADRLRAIVMTTLTTVGGLVPLAYGLGGTDPFMAPMALALGYGILFATPLTLVLVPCIYIIGNDIHRIWDRLSALIKRSSGNGKRGMGAF
jgi:multidrug efflux pump subunit AcrB